MDVLKNSDEISGTIEEFRHIYKTLQSADPYQSHRDLLLRNLFLKSSTLFKNSDKKWVQARIFRQQIKNQEFKILISNAGSLGILAEIYPAISGHILHLIVIREEARRHAILNTWRQTLYDLLGFDLGQFFNAFKPRVHLHIGIMEMQLCLIKASWLYGVNLIWT